MTVVPNIISFVIADKVIQEKNTNKWSIIGIFDKFYSSHFPVYINSLGLYIRLSDAEGEYNVRVEFCDTNDRVLAKVEGIKITLKSRLHNAEFGVQTNILPIPKPGRYFFKLYFNDKFIKDFPLISEKYSLK